jgi:hypothetical protein
MTNYQFHEDITADDGETVTFPILVHELNSTPHSLIGVPQWASDDEIDRAVGQLEEKLGYELEKPDEYDEIQMTDEEAKGYFPKQAGFDDNGRFFAG